MGEVKVHDHKVGPATCSIRTYFVPFMRYGYFKIWPWKLKVNVKDNVT